MAAIGMFSRLRGKRQNGLKFRTVFQRFYSEIVKAKKPPSTSEISIPHRIERGPTDVLKALTSTISKDYTAASYKYEDDPYFIPVSHVAKRAFALSKESGKKAARYFLEKYPELFKCNTSEPHIKAFDPPIVYTEDDNVTPDTLRTCIQDIQVNNAITVYEILRTKDIDVSQEIKQELLELLCFHNCIQPENEDYYEERYFKNEEKRKKKLWNDNGMAETLFQDMEKDNKAYSTMICGKSKFFDVQQAFALYEEMRSKGFSGTVSAYNNLIPLVSYFVDMPESRWEFMLDLLKKMNTDGLKPNLHTMNSVLEVLSYIKNWRKCRSHSLSILAEMKKLNIEPSLGTYFYILLIFFNNGLLNPNVLIEILNEVEGKQFSVKHYSDVRFFTAAMEICYKFVQNKDVAYRLHNLLEHGENCKFLGGALSESIYFKYFFQTLCDYEDIDKFMEVYEKYVPHTYTPEAGVMQKIIETVNLCGVNKHLPRICSDLILFEHTEREHILSPLFEAIGSVRHEEKNQSVLVEMVWKIIEKLDARASRRTYAFPWTGTILGNAMNTFLYGNDLEKAWAIMQRLKNEENAIVGYPEKETLLKFCSAFLESNDLVKVAHCMKYAVNGAHPNFPTDLQMTADELLKKQKISEEIRSEVDSVIHMTTDLKDDEDSSSSSSSSSSDEEEETSQSAKSKE